MRHISALSLVLCASLPALAHAQTNISGSRTMTATNTVDAAAAAGRHTPGEDVRPFRVAMSAEALNDLRRRLQATRWADKEPVADASQGVQLATLKELTRYWTTTYDWRKAEARLNALPQFVTNIDGLDIHFIHVSRRKRTRCRSSSPTGGRARSSSSSRSSGRSPIRPPTAAVPRTRSTS